MHESLPVVPGIKAMNKDSLFMESNNSPYMEKVPIQLGTLHIREAISARYANLVFPLIMHSSFHWFSGFLFCLVRSVH